MELSQKITYHATHAYIHLKELADTEIPDLSQSNVQLLKDAAKVVDGLAAVYAEKG